MKSRLSHCSHLSVINTRLDLFVITRSLFTLVCYQYTVWSLCVDTVIVHTCLLSIHVLIPLWWLGHCSHLCVINTRLDPFVSIRLVLWPSDIPCRVSWPLLPFTTILGDNTVDTCVDETVRDTGLSILVLTTTTLSLSSNTGSMYVLILVFFFQIEAYSVSSTDFS